VAEGLLRPRAESKGMSKVITEVLEGVSTRQPVKEGKEGTTVDRGIE
jgi:hypothetical protein